MAAELVEAGHDGDDVGHAEADALGVDEAGGSTASTPRADGHEAANSLNGAWILSKEPTKVLYSSLSSPRPVLSAAGPGAALSDSQ